jgi:DegV family protein with EDD domain
MHKIALLTDSTCDIPPALIEQYQIGVLPYVLAWNGVEYRDRVTLQPEEFYRRLQVEPNLPTHAQVSPAEFAQLFGQARREGAEALMIILVNSAFSGSVNSARQAAAETNFAVHVHDALSTSMGMGWQVLAAARAREAGAGLPAMIAAAEAVRSKVQVYACLDTLEYVYRGGRIGNAKRLVGAMLHVKPVLTIDHQTGLVEPAGIALAHRRGVELMCRRFFEKIDTARPMHIAVMHGDLESEALRLKERIDALFNPVELFTHITGPVLGVNTGPRAIALCGYSE